MKLPPLALTAPSLCPRCDAPAKFLDTCVQCALPLRQCGRCLGVAGPFDHYCGFCGHELVLGRARSAVWRLWILAALIPIVAGLAFGLSPLATRSIGFLDARTGHAAAPSTRSFASSSLGFRTVVPAAWKVSTPAGVVVLSANPADVKVADSGTGALAGAAPAGVVVVLGRPHLAPPNIDAADPLTVLAYDTAALIGTPPPGATLVQETAPQAAKVAGRSAALAVFRITLSGHTRYFERVYISAPGGGLFVVEALVGAGDRTALQRLLASLSLQR